MIGLFILFELCYSSRVCTVPRTTTVTETNLGTVCYTLDAKNNETNTFYCSLILDYEKSLSVYSGDFVTVRCEQADVTTVRYASLTVGVCRKMAELSLVLVGVLGILFIALILLTNEH